MIRIALALALLASTAAAAADLRPWSGPGPEAGRCTGCADPCDPLDALARVPDGARHAIAEAMQDDPRPIPLRDGDLLDGIAYCGGWDEGWRTVEGDWPAEGWSTVHDGRLYAVVVIAACGNPAVLVRRLEPALVTPVSATLLRPIYAETGWRLSTLPLGAPGLPENWTIRTPDGPETPAPIPLPGALAMMLAGLAGLAAIKWRRTT